MRNGGDKVVSRSTICIGLSPADGSPPGEFGGGQLGLGKDRSMQRN